MRYNPSGKYRENQKIWLLLEDGLPLNVADRKMSKNKGIHLQGVTFKRKDGYYTNSQDPIFRIDSAYL